MSDGQSLSKADQAARVGAWLLVASFAGIWLTHRMESESVSLHSFWGDAKVAFVFGGCVTWLALTGLMPFINRDFWRRNRWVWFVWAASGLVWFTFLVGLFLFLFP